MTERKGKILLTFIIVSLSIFFISFDCISQDTSSTQKTLMLVKTTLKNGLFKPKQKVFYLNSKVALQRYSNDKVLRGRIDSINDSTIFLKGNSVHITDIKRINAFRGKGLTIFGGSLIAVSLGLFYAFAYTPPNYYGVQYINVPIFTTGILGCAVGIIITGIGLVEIITTKYYRLDRDYKIVIK